MEIFSNVELGSNNFNQYNFFEKYDVDLHKAILENLKVKIEERDEMIMNSNWRKNKGYIVKDIQRRTIITKYGPINYKRRRYVYWDAEKNKYKYTYLVDREFQIESLERISLHLKIKILEEIASGSRQKDILRLYENSGISKMTISNIIRQFDFVNLYELETFPYKKINIKNNLYIWVDDTFVKLRNKFKKAVKYRFRLVTFHTGYVNNDNYKNYRKVLENKRAFCIVKSENESINTTKFVQKIYKMANKFYNNVNNAKIIIGGDGAKWISETAKELGAEYVLDLFHATRKLHLDLKKKQTPVYDNIFKQATNFLKNGQYNELIPYLKKCDMFMWKDQQKVKLKSLIQYFINKKEGVINQGASWNIGVNAEGQISHIIKWLLSYGSKIFNVKTFKNMLHVRIANINGINPVNLLREELEDERLEEIKQLKQNNWKVTKNQPEFYIRGKLIEHLPSKRLKMYWRLCEEDEYFLN